MTRPGRHDRIERLLIARVEELAHALESSGLPSESITRLLESAYVATTNAVALNLISAEVADEIWRGAAKRHPQVTLRRAA
jgi:hypothetical protein